MCIFGHKWYYDAMTAIRPADERIVCSINCCKESQYCTKTTSKPHYIARKHCLSCKKMKSEVVTDGHFIILHGQLEPDLKSWANL